MDNKDIFAKNLKKYMELNNKSRRDVAEAIGVSYFTFSDWVKGKTYPRMNKVELLANYFGVLKSDLIEEKGAEHEEMRKKNNAIADIVLKLKTDEEFLSVVQTISLLEKEKLSSLLALLK